MKTSNPRQWYRNLKRIAGYDAKEDKPIVEEKKNFSDIDQAEHIAESFSKISNQYAPIDRSVTKLEDINRGDYLKTDSKEVFNTIN